MIDKFPSDTFRNGRGGGQSTTARAMLFCVLFMPFCVLFMHGRSNPTGKLLDFRRSRLRRRVAVGALLVLPLVLVGFVSNVEISSRLLSPSSHQLKKPSKEFLRFGTLRVASLFSALFLSPRCVFVGCVCFFEIESVPDVALLDLRSCCCNGRTRRTSSPARFCSS